MVFSFFDSKSKMASNNSFVFGIVGFLIGIAIASTIASTVQSDYYSFVALENFGDGKRIKKELIARTFENVNVAPENRKKMERNIGDLADNMLNKPSLQNAFMHMALRNVNIVAENRKKIEANVKKMIDEVSINFPRKHRNHHR